MVGETDEGRSLNGSSASMEASSITQTPAWRVACRPRARRTVWCEGADMSTSYRASASNTTRVDAPRCRESGKGLTLADGDRYAAWTHGANVRVLDGRGRRRR